MAKKHEKVDREIITDGDFSTATDGLSGNRVFVSVAKTINLGNYESIRIEFGVGRTVNDGEKFDKVTAACWSEAGCSLREIVVIIEESIK